MKTHFRSIGKARTTSTATRSKQLPFNGSITSGINHSTRSAGSNASNSSTILVSNVPEKQLFANPPHQVPSLTGVPVVTSVVSYLATAPPNVGCGGHAFGPVDWL